MGDTLPLTDQAGAGDGFAIIQNLGMAAQPLAVHLSRKRLEHLAAFLGQPAMGQFLNAIGDADFQVGPAVVGCARSKKPFPFFLQLVHAHGFQSREAGEDSLVGGRVFAWLATPSIFWTHRHRPKPNASARFWSCFVACRMSSRMRFSRRLLRWRNR